PGSRPPSSGTSTGSRELRAEGRYRPTWLEGRYRRAGASITITHDGPGVYGLHVTGLGNAGPIPALTPAAGVPTLEWDGGACNPSNGEQITTVRTSTGQDANWSVTLVGSTNGFFVGGSSQGAGARASAAGANGSGRANPALASP